LDGDHVAIAGRLGEFLLIVFEPHRLDILPGLHGICSGSDANLKRTAQRQRSNNGQERGAATRRQDLHHVHAPQEFSMHG
jgi:hypothetical protein